MAFLYDQGKYGVKRDKKKAEENMVNMIREKEENKTKNIINNNDWCNINNYVCDVTISWFVFTQM